MLPAYPQGKAGAKFILPEEEQSESVKVKVDTSNILIESFSGTERFRKLPSDSFAGVLGMPQKHIRWYPAQDHDNLNKMLIRETSQSFDSSVLLFAEATGENGGPAGTRLIFIDTTNLVVLKIIELPFYAYEVRCQGSSGKVWMIRKSQKDMLNDTDAICIFNVKTEKMEQEIPVDTLPARLYPHITGKFAWVLEDGKIYHLYPDGKKERFLEISDAKDLRISPDCQYLAVMNGKETVLYSSEQKSPVYRVKLVPDMTFLFLGGDPPSLLIGKNLSGLSGLDWPETLYIVRKGAARLLFRNLSGSVVMDPSGRVFYAVKPKNRVEKRDSSNGNIMSSYMTTSLKPETPGRIHLLFQARETGHFLLFDSVGGLNKVDATPRRWKKSNMMRPWTE